MKPKHYPLLLLFITLAYVAAGRLGLSQAFINASVSSVWPPTGVAIAAVWLLGYRITPAILAGAFLLDLTTGLTIATAAGIAAGNTLEAVIAVALVHRFVGYDNPFYHAHDTVKFALCAGVVSVPLAATTGVMSLCLGGAAAWNNFGALWLTWWLGDIVSALVLAPALLTWLAGPAERWTLKERGEAAALLVSASAVAFVVFGGLFLPNRGNYPLEHLIIPFVLWAAFRLAPRGAATTIAVLSGIAIWGTGRGFGAFAEYGPNDSLMLLQVFIGAIALTSLVLAAIVAERKRTNEALRDKETQLQLITDITPVMLTECDRGLRYTFVNRAYAEMFGLIPSYIVGKRIPDIIGDAAYQTIRPYVERALAGHPVEYEAEVPYYRAGRRFMRIAYMPDCDESGATVGWVASITDITDRKRIEEQIEKLNAELQRHIEEFQTLIETAPIGIGVATDPECNYIWGNREFLHMLGAGRDQNLSKNSPAGDELPFRVLRDGKEVLDGDLPMQRACREGKEVLDDELEIVRGDGTIVVELCRAHPLRDEEGRVRGCIGVFLNITERKQAELEREQLLAREREARAEAEAAGRVKDEFLAVISHELRTPLNSILGWAQLLRTGRTDAVTAERALETIERNAKAQARLVDDLLDVSGVVSGKLRLDIQPVDLTSVINAAVDSVRHALEAKGIQLQIVQDPEAGKIQGDATRLQQVIWNLLSNAVKFTRKGGRIEIRLERKDREAQLTVSDTGEGINPDFLPHVFDRFRQEDSSRARRHGGLGLGLAIVRHLVEMHGGVVEAYSAGENQGAAFTIQLPLMEESRVPERFGQAG